MELEDQRPLKKSEATTRIMGTPNPETNKPHSASSAKDVVESDDRYMEHRRLQYDAVVDEETARGKFKASVLRGAILVGGEV